MKKLSKGIGIMASFVLLLLVACKNESKTKSVVTSEEEPLEMTEVSPKILFENDYTVVSKVSLTPGEYLGTHDGENRLIYSLSDYTIDWEENGKNLGAKSWKKGDMHYHEGGSHAAANNGSTVAEWLVFTKKTTELPECDDTDSTNDVTVVAPEFSTVVFENDMFKATKVVLPKGETIASHSGINRIIYSLTDYSLNYNSDVEGESDNTFKTGDIHWHEACMHSLENSGETNAEFLVINYKR
jgi:hypothetical protein